MPRIPDTAMHNVTITGPMWSAKVDILKLVNPEQDWAFRTLFVDLTARNRLGQSNSLLPGTMILLGVVRQVTIQLGNQSSSGYEWRRSEHLPVPPLNEQSQTQLRELITTGQCSLLLVQADPDGWPTQFPQRQPMPYFPTSLTCLAGEIFLGLGGLESQGQAVEHLYTKLFLQLAVAAFEQRHGNDQTDRARVQPSRLLSQVSVHGSGVSLYGQVQLPWQADQIAAPFLLTQDFPQRYNHPILRLRPEKNRLTQEEVTSWVSAWNQLSGYLNPNHPLNKQVRADQLPQWVTLELTTPNQVPDLFWLFRSENALPKLRFEPDEFSLLVSDRPPYDGQNPPDSLARIAPAWVEIDGNGDSLTINFDTQPESIATASSAPEVDRLSYTYQVTESETGTQSEEFFSATELRTAFSPVEVPQFLRKIQGRPESDYALDDITISKPPQATAAQQGSDSDDQQNGTINPWLLWGFMPLQNGWAQLPFLNLTEQLYLDLDLDGAAASSEATQSLLQGAVALGNETVLSTYLDEQPWNLTLTDADRIYGNWKYGRPNAQTNAQTNNSWVLREIKLDIENPTTIFNGLLWLSTQAPRLVDAIPDLDNWVNGLRSFALRTARPDRDLFPSPMLMAVQNLQLKARPASSRVQPSAELANWQLNYRLDQRPVAKFGGSTVYEQMQRKFLSRGFLDQQPLIWQRHARLPMIQALPLTQLQSPANYPSSSRQLVPYEIPFLQANSTLSQGLQFTATGSTMWLRLADANRDALAPATEWKSQPDLPLVALSLPGLQLVPSQSNQELVCQYRFDLPYTDEINAFAQLPEPPQSPEFVSPLPQSPPPEPPYPLVRDTYATHWQRLSERASLSSADGTLALDLNESTNEQGKLDLRHLIEPYVWSVQPTFQLENYPGHLSLANGSTLELKDNSALEGISGQFSVSGRQLTRLENSAPHDSDTFAVTAGSLAAKLTPQGLHDQRGLVRGLTQMDQDESWLQTPVVFYKTAEQELAYALTTTAKPISLQVGNQQWQMWFRDLPLRLAQATQSETGQFLRQARLSPYVQDVNDPEARSRDFDFLSGYEWRLAAPNPSKDEPSKNTSLSYLPLFGLHFYPLTLEQVELRQGKPERVVMIGRLQLPLRDIKELEDFSNAVRLEFSVEGANQDLSLKAVTLVAFTGDQNAASEGAEGEWPLALNQGEAFDAPMLVWRTIALQQDDSGPFIEIKDAFLKFVLFDYLWSVPLKPENHSEGLALRFPPKRTSQTQTNRSHEYSIPVSDQALYLLPKLLTLEIDLQTRNHTVELDLDIQLGSTDSNRNSFEAKVQFPILKDEKPAAPIWLAGHLLGVIPLTVANHQLTTNHQAFQFHWETASVTNAPQLLPGITLDTEPDGKPSLPGFVALTFDLRSSKQPESSTDESDIPLLTLTSAFVEALLSCKWGEFLQTDAPNQATLKPTASITQVFGSSAGDLTCSYTADLQIKPTERSQSEPVLVWQETLIFNGMLEIKNLISWPEELKLDPQSPTTTVLLPSLPKPPEQRSLKHRRHTLRILLNQHRLPLEQMTQNRSLNRDTIFHLATNAAWEFLAVVEHQLIDVELIDVEIQPSSNPSETAKIKTEIKTDRRWTVTQPVRWLTLANFKAQLEKLHAISTPDPATGIDKSGSGFFDPVFRQALIKELEQLLKQSPSLLLVEASGHFWLNQTPLTTLSPTTLQFLPNGAQLGILSNPDHYSPSDPIHPDWLLLTLPCLGRLQLPGSDGLDQSSSQPQVSSPLQVDPILYLKRHPEPAKLALMLTTWQPTTSDGTPIRLAISSVDTATGRTWARLDPLALQESWFRLQHPVAEPPAERLQSVIAAQPDSPARLSRLAALKQNIASYRQAVPPLPTNHSGSQPPPEPVQAIKTEPLRRTGLPILALPQEGALPTDLQVLYLFQGGSGSRVMDRSGVGEPLDLDLMERSGGQEPPWRWEGDGLRLLRSSILIANRPATKLINACRSTQELTIEVWLELDADQTRATRLAPIVTLSNDPNNRYFTLAQGGRDNQSGGDLFSVRLRTDSTTHSDGTRAAAGTPLDRTAPIATDPGSAKAGLSHIVFTRQSNGLMKVYIDGQERASNTLLNGLFPVYRGQNSDQTFRLGLGNEILGNSPWLGKYYRVAIYSRALTVAEVQSQFSQGYAVWAVPGLQIATSKLAEAPVTLSRYAAATLLTTAPPSAQLQAQSLAISPYLGLIFQPAAKDYTLSLVSAELLCLNQATKTLRPITSHLWEVPSSSTPEELLQTSIDWAKEIHARLCPESPVAVLRFREIRRLAGETDPFAAPIVTSYSYQIISDLAITELPLKRVFQLRSQLPQLRFSEGQWGGTSLPSQLQPSELAPPQTIGVQPIYLTERPGQGAWPWGLSSLRVSVRHAAQGVTGRLDATSNHTLWWQAPQYTVQYRTNTNGVTAGLPDLFRARAISSLLPTALKPQLPAIDMTETFAIRTETVDQKTVVKSKAESHWQAVLPSMMRYLLIGDRPGVFFNLRNQLLRQGDLNPVGTTPDSLQNSAENFSNHSVFVSGSVPVQHRMPRPVPLPPNPEQGRPNSLALQPWASYFHPTETVWVEASPTDEAFLAADLIQNKPARGLRLRLTEPSSGAIPANWDGYLKFKLASYRGAGNQPTPLLDWEVSEMSAVVGNQTFTFALVQTIATRLNWELEFKTSNLPALKDQLALLAAGSTLSIQARVRPKPDANGLDDGFQQSLSFALRLTSDRTLPLPLKPQFLQFEDPEYNRQLASPTAHSSTQVTVPSPGGLTKLISLRLATDRREYNPDSLLTWRYDWADTEPSPASNLGQIDAVFPARTLQIKRIRKGGEALLSLPSGSPTNLNTGVVYQLSLSQLTQSDRGTTPVASAVLQPNDILQLTLQLFQDEDATQLSHVLVLAVNIVANPVQPVPNAAYGLLRQNLDGSVECVRFAWGVIPDRVDLVNPNDLKTEVVRRRALFRWIDTKRPQHNVKYGVQKITQTGSTDCKLSF